MVFVVKQHWKTLAAFNCRAHAIDFYNWNEPDEMSQFVEDDSHVLEDYLDGDTFHDDDDCGEFPYVDEQGTTIATFRFKADREMFAEKWS